MSKKDTRRETKRESKRLSSRKSRKSTLMILDEDTPLIPSVQTGFCAEKEVHVFQDEKDVSIHPSFTHFKIPYDVQCRMRYAAKAKLYELQFQKELKLLETHQTSAYEAARHLCMTTLWPQLYNRKDQKFFLTKFFRYSDKQQRRLHYLLGEDQT